ncbi:MULTISPECIES: outer membrane protein assembly factor BamD [Nostocales]|uniref:Outer membrane protein assembly factor BamD n=3 Tax=Nostocales TaxID=1161 RepID=A0A0C1RFT2_9CYAN|nr:tetratricopeptide repeat protein [Tolypothrix bouteillei]KAF3887013.1 outer membrane protein assembly factor BamD [Tolypothrix bouteillei VB521301]
MSSESLEIAKIRYQAGRIAFEKGQYREAVEQLSKASDLLAPNSRLAGEVKLWLVTAYEAAGRSEEALDLCEQLKRHPHLETSKQAKELHYILKAPRLQRPKEWMTEIPDLGAIADNETNTRFAVKPSSSQRQMRPEPEFVDLSQVNTKDNRFIWVALIAIGLILGGLLWMGLSG